MNLKLGTFLDTCDTPLPIRIKNLIPIYWVYLKLGTFQGVCNTPIPVRIKNLIPIYQMNLKLDRFLGVCLYDQPHLDGKRLKFVWLIVKPGGDWMDVTNATQTPTSYS